MQNKKKILKYFTWLNKFPNQTKSIFKVILTPILCTTTKHNIVKFNLVETYALKSFCYRLKLFFFILFNTILAKIWKNYFSKIVAHLN
jgi:hypothetical protein